MSTRPLIVIPVHNRRETTLACLGRLREHGVTRWADPLVVDDGSRDGTGAAVRRSFPEVEIITGDGGLFWTGATALGMGRALARGAQSVFWLNDDTEPGRGALETLARTVERRGGAAGGVCHLPRSGAPVYAGFVRHGSGLRFVAAEPGQERPCHALNGNLVCLSRAAIESAGLPDARAFPHAFGDTDYTLRVHDLGYPVTLVGDATAKALPNNPGNHASWFVGETTAGRLWGDLGRKTSYAYLPAHWRFCTRHWGWRGAAACGWLLAKRVPATAILLTVPRSWRVALWGKRSSVWKTERLIREETGR